MKKIFFLAVVVFSLFSCKKENGGIVYEPEHGCKTEKEDLNILFERGGCESFVGIKDTLGGIDKTKLYAIAFLTEDQEKHDETIVCNFRLEDNQRIYINVAKESLNFIYRGSEVFIKLIDAVNKKDYLISVKATKRDKNCRDYIGYEDKDVKVDMRDAEFVEKDGKKYIVVKKKCNC